MLLDQLAAAGHRSGASAWLNDSTHRRCFGKALAHARREIARLDDPVEHVFEVSDGNPVCEDALMVTIFTRIPAAT